MLACARLGRDPFRRLRRFFAANELAVRIDDCEPKCIIAASCGFEPGRVVHYKPAARWCARVSPRHQPEFCVIFQREQEVAHLEEGRDHDWHAFQYGVEPAKLRAGRGQPPGLYPLYLGTTGQPEGVCAPHRRASRGAQLVDAQLLYDMNPGEVFWAALGRGAGFQWGHSYICYAPLTFVGAPPSSSRASTVGHARCRHLLAGDRGSRGQRLPLLPRPPALPRDQARTIRSGALIG